MENEIPKPRHPRDFGGSATLNNPDDGTAIREMIGLDNFMLLVTDRCTYRVQMADQIDPTRTNPNLPFTSQQKLFDHGMKSETLCRSLLHARAMFRVEFQEIDIAVAMGHTLEALSHLIAMQDLARNFSANEIEAIRKVEALGRKGKSLTLPAVGDVRGQCKAFIQRADHCSDALLEIVRLFEPEMKAKGWSKLPYLLVSRYGADDPFCEFVKRAAPLLQLVLDARDCFEHQRPGIETDDFAANADGTVSMPKITISYRKSKQPPCDVSKFMELLAGSMLTAFEMITVHLCAKHMKAFAGMPMVIDYVPESFKASWPGRFCYGMYYADGNFVPCG